MVRRLITIIEDISHRYSRGRRQHRSTSETRLATISAAACKQTNVSDASATGDSAHSHLPAQRRRHFLRTRLGAFFTFYTCLLAYATVLLYYRWIPYTYTRPVILTLGCCHVIIGGLNDAICPLLYRTYQLSILYFFCLFKLIIQVLIKNN